MNLVLRTPTVTEFQRIKDYITEFELDNRALKQEEFIAAFRNDELVGFGRIREYADCSELCSLGVVTLHRRQGVGKALVKALIEKAQSDLFLVCIIPDFFIPLGFAVTEIYPAAIRDKISYCTYELIAPEKYVAMKHLY
jgi:N-acetylglutamate synthase-like GNAT family acetyltransferase